MSLLTAVRHSFSILFVITIPYSLVSQTNAKKQNKETTRPAKPEQVVFMVGNLTDTRVNVDSFKAQTTIKITGGYFCNSATVYFSGANFTNVIQASLLGSSLNSIAIYIKRCGPGSVISFDNVRVSTPDGLRTIEGRSYTLYSGNYDTLKIPISLINQEIHELIKTDFISGTIYFSGANFSNIVIAKVKEADLIRSLFARCGPGSIISFDNCLYKSAGNTLLKSVNKSLKME